MQVLVRPTVTKTFNPSTIKYNQSSTLTLTLGNSNDVPITLSQNLVDTLPGNVFLATPATIGGTCINTNPGKVIAANGGGTVTYQSGATIPAGGCTITVPVTSTTMGDYTNTLNADDLKTDAGTNPAPASALLIVLAPPTLSKSFSPTPIIAGAPSTLTLTLGNPNTHVHNAAIGAHRQPSRHRKGGEPALRRRHMPRRRHGCCGRGYHHLRQWCHHPDRRLHHNRKCGRLNSRRLCQYDSVRRPRYRGGCQCRSRDRHADCCLTLHDQVDHRREPRAGFAKSEVIRLLEIQ